MPYKYIGRRHDFVGKSLWEIVGNLKNFGVGRIVVRSKLERYPEPTYMKILKVEPMDSPEMQDMDHMRRVKVMVEKTFRGKLCPDPVFISMVSYKTDYRLLPKDEEESYCKKAAEPKDQRIYPRTMEFPPLLKELIIREKKAKGEDVKEDPELEIFYNKSVSKRRIAQAGEKPTVVFGKVLPKLSLYSNIKVIDK